MMRRNGQAGVTLTELMIVSSILLVLSGTALEYFVRQADFIQTMSLGHHLNSQARLAVEQMVKELRHGTLAAGTSPPDVSIPAAPGNTTVTLYPLVDFDGNQAIVDSAGNLEWDTVNPVTFQYDANARQLLRVAAGATRVMVSHVEMVAFTDDTMDGMLDDDEVRILLMLAENTSRGRRVAHTVSAIVQLRN